MILFGIALRVSTDYFLRYISWRDILTDRYPSCHLVQLPVKKTCIKSRKANVAVYNCSWKESMVSLFSRLPQTLRPARLLTGAVRLQSRCIFSLGSNKTREDVDKSSKFAIVQHTQLTGLIPYIKFTEWVSKRTTFWFICFQSQVIVVFTRILRSHFILCLVKHRHGSHHKKRYKSFNQVRRASHCSL